MARGQQAEKIMTSALYDSFIADYYDESPIVRGRLQDVAFYRDAARDFGDPIRERVHFVQGDMTRFDLGEKFRLVIIPFRPFQHLLEIQQQLDCLNCVRKHLAPGGRLILDVFQTDAERMHDPVHMRETLITEYRAANGRQVRISERVAAFHRAEQRNDVEMIFQVKHPDGRDERLVFAWTLRYFFRYEIEHLLARCGFRVVRLYGNFDRSPLSDASPEMIYVAESP